MTTNDFGSPRRRDCDEVLGLWFSGTHEHTLDGKGRVILPASFRDELAGGLVLAPGQDRCIDVYPREVFRERVQQLRELPREDSRARAFTRFFMAQAEQAVPDSQGRITLPQRLRDYAGLDRELTIIGNDTRVEIWDRTTWDQYMERAEPDFADLDTPFDF